MKIDWVYFGDISADNQWRIIIFVSNLMFLGSSNIMRTLLNIWTSRLDHKLKYFVWRMWNHLKFHEFWFCNMTIILCLAWLIMTWSLWLFYNKHIIVSVGKVSKVIRGPPSNHQGGGGTGVFVANKLFISTKLGGVLCQLLLHVYIEQFLTYIKLYFTQSLPGIIYFRKTTASPPPVDWMVFRGPLTKTLEWTCWHIH